MIFLEKVMKILGLNKFFKAWLLLSLQRLLRKSYTKIKNFFKNFFYFFSVWHGTCFIYKCKRNFRDEWGRENESNGNGNYEYNNKCRRL